MSSSNIRHYQTSPRHLGKLRDARIDASYHETFVKTFVTATVIGVAVIYIFSLAAAAVAGLTDVVYLQGGGPWASMPLNLFALFMAISFTPLAFPLSLLLVAGVFALVPPINWCVKRSVDYLRRKFWKRTDQSDRMQSLRPISR